LPVDLTLLNGADIALLGIIAISCAVGIWRGFAVEVLSLAAWVVAFWMAFAYGETVAGVFGEQFATPAARLLLGYALLFVAALVTGSLATWLIGRMVRNTGLSPTDRVLGMGFGLLRGIVLSCIGVLLLGFTPFPADPWWQQSRLLPGLQPGAEWLRTWLPDPVAEHIRFDATLPLGLPTALQPMAPTVEPPH
jgi:membrane protein required for colicin V production